MESPEKKTSIKAKPIFYQGLLVFGDYKAVAKDSRLRQVKWGGSRNIPYATFSNQTASKLPFPDDFVKERWYPGTAVIGREPFYRNVVSNAVNRAHAIKDSKSAPLADNKGIVCVTRKILGKIDDYIDPLIAMLKGEFKTINDDEEALYFVVPKNSSGDKENGNWWEKPPEGWNTHDVRLTKLDAFLRFSKNTLGNSEIEGVVSSNKGEVKFLLDTDGISIVVPYRGADLRIDYKWIVESQEDHYLGWTKLYRDLVPVHMYISDPSPSHDPNPRWNMPIVAAFHGLGKARIVGDRGERMYDKENSSKFDMRVFAETQNGEISPDGRKHPEIVISNVNKVIGPEVNELLNTDVRKLPPDKIHELVGIIHSLIDGISIVKDPENIQQLLEI